MLWVCSCFYVFKITKPLTSDCLGLCPITLKCCWSPLEGLSCIDAASSKIKPTSAPTTPHLQGLHCSLPYEHSWDFPTRRSTSPPHSWSSSHSGTAPRPPVLCNTWLAETSFCHPWRWLWLAAVGRQSEPPARRWADATAPHKSLNDAWAVLKVSHTAVTFGPTVRTSSTSQRRRRKKQVSATTGSSQTSTSVHWEKKREN